MGQILKIGVPIALQDGFIQIAFIIITIMLTGAAWKQRLQSVL